MANRRQPLISVAIAARNYGRYLPRALDSVFRCHNPTPAPIQVVVADDASTDDTRAILADYRQRHPQELEIVSLRIPMGLGRAKNAALERCTGRTVALLDADDEFLPEKFIHCHALLERGGLDMITNDFYHCEEGKLRLRNRKTWHYWFWPPSNWTFRNGVVRFNPRVVAAEDMEWMERRWWSLRRYHLDRALNIQHIHHGQLFRTWDSNVPGIQLGNRVGGLVHPFDRQAPPIWSCRECGNQYLLPTSCCGRGAVERPLVFYQLASSPHMRAQVEFSFVILARNGLALTRRAVSSLLATLPSSQATSVELIFVDGYSTDGTLDYIRQLARNYSVKLILTHPAERFQYPRACNRGAMVAVGRYLFLVNNDIEIQSPHPLEPLRAALSDPRVGVVGTSTVWGPAQRDPDWTSGPPLYRTVNRPLKGAFWGTRRELYWDLNGLDEAFTGYGYEELDFQFRAQLAQYHLAVANVRMSHAAQATFGPLYGAERLKALESRNREEFERKHGRRVEWGARAVEPFASQRGAEATLVVTVRDEAPALRATLAKAARDPGCQEGRLQVVVVVEGTGDETAEVLEEYRGRLGPALTVVRVAEEIGRARAQAIGRTRAIGQRIRELAPGDWPEDATRPRGEWECLAANP